MENEIGWRVKLAWAVAIAADFLQIVAFPLLWAGAASPLDDVLDVFAAGALIALLGWHWVFLPSFVVKLTPVLDIVPSWTAAVFLALRKPETIETTILPTPQKLLPPQAGSPPRSAEPQPGSAGAERGVPERSSL